MKQLKNFIPSRLKRVLSFMSILTVCFLMSSTEIRMWGAHKQVIKFGGSFALIGLVATFKKKGIDLTEDELKQFTAIDEAFVEHTKGLVTLDALNEKLTEAKKGLDEASIKKLVDTATTEITETLQKQAIAIDQLKTLGVPIPNGKVKSLKEQIREQLDTAENKAVREAMKAERADASGKGFSMEIKAIGAGPETIAGTTAYGTAGTSIAFPTPEFIPGLNNVARNQPFLIQLLNVMSTAKENIAYAEKLNVTGSPAWVGENVAAPQVAFDIKISNSRARMVTAYIKVSTQMLDDVDYMAAEIEKELIYQEAIKIDTDLLQGDGIGDNLSGIKASASAYVLNTIATTSPNNADAVIAGAAQISYDNFIPDIAVMNPLDVTNTTLLKGSTGYYLINPNNKDNRWGKVLVIESNQVPVGYVMIMDSSKTNVFRYQDFTLSYGFVNDDFTKHMVTIMATQRLHSFIKSNDVNAFVYDTLANIKTAITAA